MENFIFCAMISFPCSNIHDLHVKFFFTCHYTNFYFRTIRIFAVDTVWNLDLIYSSWYYDIQWNEWQVVSKMTKVTLKEKNMKSSFQTMAISLRLNNPWINYLTAYITEILLANVSLYVVSFFDIWKILHE